MIIVAAMLSVENIHSDQGPQMKDAIGTRKDHDEIRKFTSTVAKEGPGDHIYLLKIFKKWILQGESKGEDVPLMYTTE